MVHVPMFSIVNARLTCCRVDVYNLNPSPRSRIRNQQCAFTSSPVFNNEYDATRPSPFRLTTLSPQSEAIVIDASSPLLAVNVIRRVAYSEPCGLRLAASVTGSSDPPETIVHLPLPAIVIEEIVDRSVGRVRDRKGRRPSTFVDAEVNLYQGQLMESG